MRLHPLMTAALAAVAATCLLAATPSPADNAGALRAAPGESVTTTWYEALDALPEADEARDGYVRTAFRHWIDADKDGCNARQEVLIAESLEQPVVGARCVIAGGRWLSLYDNLEFTDPGRLDVDHLVPLAEAWDSGASAWTAAERQAYANDLDEDRALIAVSAASNRSKADKDPADWQPPATAYRCRYAADWTAIKTRWHLAADPAEKAALEALKADCPNRDLTVTIAR
ncbi:hypothetical protein KNE206_30700 [Kitasatospora sp. NE20-6]|uniref:HNH endonuclease family protein n=1 Tax=Kitasatospora sp. NE20-6 TaxID=2859066 RepID=UPI0034DC2560